MVVSYATPRLSLSHTPRAPKGYLTVHMRNIKRAKLQQKRVCGTAARAGATLRKARLSFQQRVGGEGWAAAAAPRTARGACRSLRRHYYARRPSEATPPRVPPSSTGVKERWREKRELPAPIILVHSGYGSAIFDVKHAKLSNFSPPSGSRDSSMSWPP